MDSMTKERAMKAVLALAIAGAAYLAILAVSSLKAYQYIGGNYPNVISVSGEGEVFAVPDVAEFSFSVIEEGATLTEAQEAAATKMNAAIAYIKSQGVDEKDIKTTNYSANPRYEYRDVTYTNASWETKVGAPAMMGGAEPAMMYYPEWGGDTRVLVGYEVNQTLSVKVRDTDKAGAIIAGVTETGITNVYGPNFTIDDEDELKREARQNAIEDARTKAKQLAKDLDVRLVRVVSFSEDGGGYYPMYAKAEMMSADVGMTSVAPELPTGENRISSYVTITYEIR